MTTKYRDACIHGRRSYEIEGDKVHVKGCTFSSSDFEATLKLIDLDESYEKQRLRSPLLIPMLVLLLIGVFGLLISQDFIDSDDLTLAESFFFGFILAGSIGSAFSWRKTPAVVIKNHSGVPALIIFGKGPMKEYFNRFVEELCTRIEMNQTSANKSVVTIPGATPPSL